MPRMASQRLKALGERVRRLRTSHSLSQSSLGDKAGVAARTVRRIEKAQNKGGIDMGTLVALAASLGVTVDFLWTGKS